MTKDSIDPPVRFDDNIRVIHNSSFFDTPRDESESEKEVPYIPNEREWSALKSEVRFQSFTTGFAIGLAAFALILGIVVFATK